MKKIYLLLTLVMVSFVMSFAGDTIKVLRIYHNGSFTTIPLANIDSINHSMYDATGELQADYTTSIIEAFDSTYNIPIYEIDSVILANVDADEFKEFMVDVNDWIANVLNNEEEIGLEDFQRRLTDWLSECGWVAKTTKEENSNIITITYTNGLNSYIDFQDLSFFEDVDEGAEIKAFSSAFSSNTQTFFDVSEQSNEEIIEKSDILLIQGRRMFLSNAEKEISAFADCKRTSPISFKYDVCPHSLDFLNWDFSKYGLIVISQTHGMGNGSFQIEDSSTELISDYLLSLYYKDGKVTKVYNNFLDYSMTLGNLLYLYKVSPQIIGNKISNSNAIVYGNYCWSTGLSRWLTTRNTVFGYSTRSIYKKNIDYLIQFVSNMYNGRTFQEAIVPLKGYSSTNYVSLETENIIPGTNNPLSKQRYFSIKTDEITKRADNGNPIITGTINGYKNLKNDLKFVAFCHEGTDNFTPEDDDVIKIEIPKDKIHDDGTFEFEFQNDMLLKSAIIYGFCFGFEYGDNTYYGETKLYGKFNGLEYEKKEEWCFVMSSEPTVLYSYDVTTHFEVTKNQKDFWIALYSGDQLVTTYPVKIEEGSNTQITSIEFGCTKEDYTFDYANFKAKVENLYLTAISNVTINGEQQWAIFNDPNEIVEFEVTYEQTPDVRFTSAELQNTEFIDGDVYIGYFVQANCTGTLFIESVELATTGTNWSGGSHDPITDLLSDDGLVSDYGMLYIENYKNQESIPSLCGYFKIKGPHLNTTSSNHIQFTSSNGKYVTGIRIIEGRRNATNASHNIRQTAKYIATDRGVTKSDEQILQDGVSTIGVKNTIPERWRNVPILQLK